MEKTYDKSINFQKPHLKVRFWWIFWIMLPLWMDFSLPLSWDCCEKAGLSLF